MENHEKLLVLYNELDSMLRKEYGENDRTKSVVSRFIKDLSNSYNEEFRVIGRKLNMIRVIRNTLVHELDMNADNLISVSDETINMLEKLNDKIRHQKNAYDICTKTSSLFCLHEGKNPSLKMILQKMTDLGHTQIPYINDKNVLKGVFSPNVLFKYLNEHSSKKVDDLFLEDVISYLPIDKHFSEKYLFVKKNTSEAQLSKLFLDAALRNEKIIMIFVTTQGYPTDPLEGVLVMKDLITE